MSGSRKGEEFLKVRVLRGRNLAVRDLWTSDPYVVLNWNGKKLKTKVINSNVNPEWNEDLTFPLQHTNVSIKMAVFDKDIFSRDDPMGNAEIDVQPLLECGMLPLETMDNGDVVRIAKANVKNCLVGESNIYVYNGKFVQDMIIRLRDVECGEVELRLELISSKVSR